MEQKIINLPEMMNVGAESLNIVITKNEVLQLDITNALNTLSQLLDDKKTALYFKEKVDISFEGFNVNENKLWEVPEVRNYICKLDEQFPFWFYFLSTNGDGLLLIFKSQLIPFLSPEADKELNQPKLRDCFLTRWLPSMNQVCDYTGISLHENDEMTQRLFNYLKSRKV